MAATDQIQAIRERCDIVSVIGAYVSLKQKGQRFVGLCPFHAEKTPSFSVTPSKGLYYCFGCHAGGDVFSFLMRYQGIDFATALRKLAPEAGVELEPESEEVRRKRVAVAEAARVNDYAQAFFEHALWHEQGRPARAYLTSRGIPEAFARERKLGFGGAPGELVAYLAAKHVPADKVAAAGLLTDDGRRCLFEGRLVFPITDDAGRLAGFGARRLGDGPGPKYINTRESAQFAKRKLLYGWTYAQEAVRRSGRVLVVEGYLDVLACHRAGLGQAVAALGTAFTEEHARACARLAKEGVVMFDGDAAGKNASREAAQRLVAAGLKTLVAPLPAGEDPDSLLRQHGPQALAAAGAAAVPALEHFIDQAFARATLSIEDRARAAQELGPLLAALTSGLERDLYAARLADRVGVSVEQLQRHLRASRPARPAAGLKPGESAPREPAASPVAPAARGPERFEIDMLRDLLLYPELRPRLGDLGEFVSDPMRLLLDDLAAGEDVAEPLLSRHIPDPRMVARLASIAPAYDDTPEEVTLRAKRTYEDVLGRLKARHIDSVLRALRQDVEERAARGEPADELEEQIRILTRRKRELTRPGSAA